MMDLLALERWHLAQLQAGLRDRLDYFEVLSLDVAGLDVAEDARWSCALDQLLDILHALHHLLDVLDQEVLVSSRWESCW